MEELYEEYSKIVYHFHADLRCAGRGFLFCCIMLYFEKSDALI